ncbi:MAG: type II toxin-antitoxin system VapC family toxin [Acidobacteria bacterium]|nr:type II toxin-antitoxin system VapC family toxin [Acidobacteriota bacterium]
MTRVLLDTHVLLWALAGHRRLPAEARRLMDEHDVVVSAASIWEVAIKAGLGKLQVDPLAVQQALEPSGFDELPVTTAHAAAVANLPPYHRDPFDRLLVAQALAEHLVLVTTDDQLAPYGDVVRLV